MDMTHRHGAGRGSAMHWEAGIATCAGPCKADSWWEPAEQHRERCRDPVLGAGGGGKEAQREGMCVYMWPIHCAVETYTTL